jgi:hypothetical protein
MLTPHTVPARGQDRRLPYLPLIVKKDDTESATHDDHRFVLVRVEVTMWRQVRARLDGVEQTMRGCRVASVGSCSSDVVADWRWLPG